MIDVTCPFRRSIDRIVALAIVGAVGLGSAVIPGEASAQLTPRGGDSKVLVDKNGTGGAAPGGTSGELLPPPRTRPRSRLLTRRPPAGAPVVEQPPPQATPPSRRQVRQTPPARPAAQPAPRPNAPAARPRAAAPATPGVAKAPPTPLTKPEPAPAPPPALKMAKPAPASPPAPKMAKPTSARPPAPKIAKPASAPPPAPKMAKPAPALTPPAPAAAPKPQAAGISGPGAAPLRSVAFAPGDADLSGDSRRVLDSFTASLTEDPNLRMQLLAYAGEPNLSASQARRLSLSRALAVRSYLISKGIRSTRIDVRALGNKVPSGTPNRVDLKTVTR